MTAEVRVPYGDRSYRLAVGADAAIALPPEPRRSAPIRTHLERALDDPIGLPTLEELCPPRGDVLIIVSDDTRDDPRRELALAAIARLPDSANLHIAIASGTHSPCDPATLGLGDDLLRRATVVRHDSRDDASLAFLGTTSRGTPVRVHRCVLDADLVVATGMIKPHYFAGFGAGAKAVFPGLGGEKEIRINHELKQHPEAKK